MIVTNQFEQLPPSPAHEAVVSLGVFDGVHLGHQAILAANVRNANSLGLRSTVVTFRGHPKEVLLGRAPRTLTSLDHRLELFRRAGIEHALVLPFDDELRSTSARSFVQHWLVERLGARAFVLGFDSKFGRGQSGNASLIQELNYPVEVVDKVIIGQRAVSSTAIREAVALGDLAGAERMLGRPVSVLGEVVEGQAVGRTLGFATANLDLHHELHPPGGVYAGRAHVLARERGHAVVETHLAVANVGRRPTLVGATGTTDPLVEVHLIDFVGDLYGRQLEFDFVRHLRDERKFPNLGALREQIAADVVAARAVLS